MSITQLAEECGTADATVSRFCRSLKLKGFNAFKIELAKHTAAVSASGLRERPVSTDTSEGRYLEAGRLSQAAISQTLALVRQKDIDRLLEIWEGITHFANFWHISLAEDKTPSSRFFEKETCGSCIPEESLII